MAKILLLSLVFPPDNVSTAHIMGDLAVDLSARGHTVSVITTIPHYNEDIDAIAGQTLYRYWTGVVSRSTYHGINVIHTWMPRKGKNKLFRIVAWLGFHAVSTLTGVLSRFKPDVILAPSPPLTIGISAWLLGLRHRCPFIYNVQEIYPDVAVDLGVLKNRSIIRFLEGLEGFVYQKSAALAVISDGMADRIRAKGIPDNKICVIPNFVDVDDFHPLPKVNPFCSKYGLENKFVVSYAGNMGKPQGLEFLIEAAHILRKEEDVHFLIMGDGSERQTLLNLISSLRLGNITFLPYQPYHLMAEAYATADASFVSQAPGTSSDGIPSKVYRIMSCARPVIACTDPDSDIARLVTKVDAGAVVNAGDPSALADVIRDAFNNRDEWIYKGIKAREAIMKGYSRSHISDRYSELIMGLQKRGAGI
jgi:colanic acid biosynthesis glycosyl transferase WcaI